MVRGRIRPLRLLLNAEHPLIACLRDASPALARLEPVLVGLTLSALLRARKLLTERSAPEYQAELVSLLGAVVRGEAPGERDGRRAGAGA